MDIVIKLNKIIFNKILTLGVNFTCFIRKPFPTGNLLFQEFTVDLNLISLCSVFFLHHSERLFKFKLKDQFF